MDVPLIPTQQSQPQLTAKKRTVPRETALEWLSGEGAKVVRNIITDNGRWSIYHELIVEVDGKLYMGDYSVGATESQDESPWQYEKEVEFVEVEAYEKTVVDYRPVAA